MRWLKQQLHEEIAMRSVPMLNPAMPQPSEDLEQLKRDMDQFGFCFIKNFLDAAQVATLKRRLAEQALAEREQGVAFLLDDPVGRIGAPLDGDERNGWNNQIVRNLFNKGSVFHPLAVDSRLRAILEHAFRGRGFYLLSYQGIVRKRGSEAQVIHSDQMWVPDQTSLPYVVNTMVMLSDFADENGGTRMVPGSHKYAMYPPATVKRAGFTGVRGIENSQPIDTVPAVAPAGTAMVFEGRTWHGAGECRADANRYAVTLYYGLDFMRQMDNIPACLHPDVYARLSKELKDMIGYDGKSLGRIEPQAPGGITNTNMPWPYTPEMQPRGTLEL